jgi:hypothetical protein
VRAGIDVADVMALLSATFRGGSPAKLFAVVRDGLRAG